MRREREGQSAPTLRQGTSAGIWSSLQGVGWKHSPPPCCFAGVSQQDLLLGVVFCDREHSWEGGNVGLWWLAHGQLKGQRLPLFPGVLPCLSWRAELFQAHPRAGLCSRRDVLEGCSPGLVPVCPSVPPCKACSAPAKGENGPKPCGFLVGVNTGKPSFHGTFHRCLSVVQSLSNSLSISAAARALFLRGAGQGRAGQGSPSSRLSMCGQITSTESGATSLPAV